MRGVYRFMVEAAANARPFESPDFDAGDLRELLAKYSKAVSSGNLEYVEAMLFGQAVALQALFARLTEYGMRIPGTPNFESFKRLALKA